MGVAQPTVSKQWRINWLCQLNKLESDRRELNKVVKRYASRVNQMFVGVSCHSQRVVGDFIVGSSSCRYFQLVWTTKVGAFEVRLQFPVDHRLVSDRDTLWLLGADCCDNAVDVLGGRQCSARTSQRDEQRSIAFYLARQVLQQQQTGTISWQYHVS